MDIQRTRFKNKIVTEFVAPYKKSSRKVMVFCSGVPGIPCKDDVLEFWAKQGYWTFFPRYRGTWESDGHFLEKSLEQDVFDVINSLSKGFQDVWSGEKYFVEPKKIVVIGTSFGGPAALLASLDPRIAKAICIAPVVNWPDEDRADPLDELYKVLQSGYRGAYRINKRNWNKLKKGQFYNPTFHIDEMVGNDILIFHAKNDRVVRYGPVANFAKEVKAHFVSLAKGGHLSSTLLMEDKYQKLLKNFLK